VLLPTVDSKQQIGNESAKQLNHETVSASGNQVVHLEVPFPPVEKGLYVPAQLINLSHFFSSQIVTVGCNPKIFAVDTVANKAQLFLSLVYTLGAEKHNLVREDNTKGSVFDCLLFCGTGGFVLAGITVWFRTSGWSGSIEQAKTAKNIAIVPVSA